METFWTRKWVGYYHSESDTWCPARLYFPLLRATNVVSTTFSVVVGLRTETIVGVPSTFPRFWRPKFQVSSSVAFRKIGVPMSEPFMGLPSSIGSRS